MSWLDKYREKPVPKTTDVPVLNTRQKTGLEKQWLDHIALKKDHEEFHKTGLIKHARSTTYRKTESELKEKQTYLQPDHQTKEEEKVELGLRKPLLYLANPLKILGDLLPYQPNLPNTELDRQKHAKEVTAIPTKTFSENMTQSFKDGLAEVPDAAINIALGGVNPEKGIAGAIRGAVDPFNFSKQIDKFIVNAGDDISLVGNTIKNKLNFNPVLADNLKVNFKSDAITKSLYSAGINKIADNEVSYLTSPEYLKIRMANTGETASEINNNINQIIKNANKTTIRSASAKKIGNANANFVKKNILNALEPLDGNFLPSFNSNAKINYTSFESALEDIDHEVKHALSPVATNSNRSIYENYPTIKLENPFNKLDPFFKETEKHIDYLQKPWEQQVRFGKIKDYMAETYGIKKGTPFKPEDTLKFLEDYDSGSFSRKKYNDVHEMLDFAKKPKNGEKIDLTGILNKAWGIVPAATAVGIGAKAASSKQNESWLDKY